MAADEKTCIFCEQQGKLTDEHIWGQWVLDHLPRSANKHDFASVSVPVPGLEHLEEVRLRAGDPLNANVKVVCRDCNSGFMSRIQQRAKPHLLPLFEGRRCVITEKGQQAIRAYCAMAVMTAEYLERSADTVKVPQSDRDYLRTMETSPPEWRFWLGHYKRKLCKSQWYRVTCPISFAENLSDITDEDSRHPNMQTTAFVIGELFIFTMNSIHSNIVRLWNWPNAPRAKSRLLAIEHGGAGAAWPISNNPMTDNDACRFSNAFRNYSERLAAEVGYR